MEDLMSVCSKCGNVVADTASFCPKCGNKVTPVVNQAAPNFTAQPQPQPNQAFNQQQPGFGAPVQNAPKKNFKESFDKFIEKLPVNKKQFAIIAGALCAVIVFLILLFGVILRTPGYEKPIKLVEKGVNKNDYTTFSKAFVPKNLTMSADLVEDISGVDASDLFSMSNYSIKIVNKQKLSDYELTQYNYNSELASYGVTFTKGYKLYVSQTGAYKGNMNQSYDTFIVGKYKGSWYIIDID